MSEYSVKTVRLRVVGIPAPKGSQRAINRGGRARLVAGGSDENKEQISTWRADIILACQRNPIPAKHPVPVFHPEEPLTIAIVFRVPARATDLRGDKLTPKPSMRALAAHGRDIDKLMRSTYDAITQSRRIWIDDSRVAAGPPVRRYVLPGQWIGADILIGTDELAVIRWYYDQVKKAKEEIEAAKSKALGPQQELLR